MGAPVCPTWPADTACRLHKLHSPRPLALGGVLGRADRNHGPYGSHSTFTTAMSRLTRHDAHWPAGVPDTGDVPERNLFSCLEASAEAFPDKVAIDYYGRQTSYRSLLGASLTLAGYMQQHLGVRRGDRVLLLMRNCPQFAIAYYAILACDAVVVVLNPMSTSEEVACHADDSGARVAIAMQDMLARLAPLLADGGLHGCIVGAYSEFAGSPGAASFTDSPEFVRDPRVPILQPRVHEFAGALAAGIAPTAMHASAGADALAAICYAGDCAAEPAGAMLSHRALVATAMQHAPWSSDLTDCSVMLSLCSVAGIGAMNQTLLQGRTMVLLASSSTVTSASLTAPDA